MVAEGLHTLMEIVDSFESAYDGGASGAAEGGGADFAAVLAAAVEPLVLMCERGAEALKATAPSRVDEGKNPAPGAQQIYLINCLAAMQAPLSRHACAAGRAATLGQLIEGHVAALVGGAVGTTLAHTHIAEIMERMRLYQDGLGGEGEVMAADPALSPTRIAEAIRAFFSALSQPDTLPEFESLQVPRIKADASAQVARGLADAYETLYHILTDPQHGYTSVTEAGEVIKHTPLHVRTILGVVT